MPDNNYNINIKLEGSDQSKAEAKALADVLQKIAKQSGNITNVMTTLDANAKNTANALTKVTKTLDDVKDGMDEVKGGSDQAGASMGKLAGAVAIGTLIADGVKAAGAALINFAVSSIKAAAEQERSMIKLEGALKAVGDTSEATKKSVLDFSDALEGSSGFAGETVSDLYALARGYGYNDAQAKQLIKTSADLAHAQGDTLETSFNKLNGSMQGNAGALAKQIPAVKALTEEQLRNGEAVRVIAGLYDGEAKRAMSGFNGTLFQVTKSYDDLQKESGKVITQNKDVKDAINTVALTIQNLTTDLKDILPSVAKFASLMAKAADWTIRTLFEETDIDRQQIKINEIYDEITKLQDTIDDHEGDVAISEVQKQKEILRMQALQSEYKRTQEVMNTMKNPVSAEAVSGVQSLLSSQSIAPVSQAPMMSSAENAPADVSGKDFNAEALAKTAAAREKQIADDKKAQEDALAAKKKYAEEVVALETETGKMVADNQVQMALLAIQGKREAGDAYNAELLAKEEGMTEERASSFAGLLEVVAEEDAIKLQMLQDRIDAEKDIKKQGLLEDQYNAQASVAIAKKKNADEILSEKNKQKAYSGILSNLSSLMNSGSREAFEVGKAASIAQATMATYQAATNALATPGVPYPVAVAFAASAVASGLMNVSNIAKTKFQKAETGGIVNAPQMSGDNTMIRVNGDEMVFNRRQQGNLFRAIDEGSFGSANITNSLLADLRDTFAAKNFNINIDGQKLNDSLSDINARRLA